MTKKIALIIASLLIACSLATASQEAPAPQEEKPPANTGATTTPSRSVYRLDYVVRELEGGKRINSRNYNLSAKSSEWARMRVGTVPLMVEPGLRQDVGIKIDCSVDDLDGRLVLVTQFESTTVASPEQGPSVAGGASSRTPFLRQVKFSGQSLVTPGKPTVIATLDDVATNRRYEIEVTVTKVE